MRNPLSSRYDGDETDKGLIRAALDGRQDALEDLIGRHQAWIYNLALRMVWDPWDAEDATQEILIRIVTNLSSFRGESAFRTWAYRVAVNHALNWRRSRAEQAVKSFDCYGKALDATPDLDFPDETRASPENLALVEEARVGCTMGMLLCLDREQRIVFVLGEIFEVTDATGSKILGISRDAFRQKLSRARRELYAFMSEKCGLVNPSNPCRCARKTQGFIRAGIVEPDRLRFARPHVVKLWEVVEARSRQVQRMADAVQASLLRNQPFYDPPDFIAGLRAVINSTGFRSLLRLDKEGHA